jgi:hypothetical protein
MTSRKRYSIQSDCLKLESGRQGLEMGCDCRLNPIHFITWSSWASPPPGPIDESRNRRAKILFFGAINPFRYRNNSAETKKSLHPIILESCLCRLLYIYESVGSGSQFHGQKLLELFTIIETILAPTTLIMKSRASPPFST